MNGQTETMHRPGTGNIRIGRLRFTLSLLLFAVAAASLAQQAERKPRIAYLYPAGGRAGTTFQIMVGGQFLRGASDVFVTGDGVTAKVVRYIQPLKPLDGDQRKLLREKLDEIRGREGGEPGDGGGMPNAEMRRRFRERAAGPGAPGDRAAANRPKNAAAKSTSATVELPDHPVLDELMKLNPAEIDYVLKDFLGPNKKRQQNSQLAESVIVEVALAPNASIGDRELRIRTPQGLTNPICFQVGQIPEVSEHEPNNPDWADTPVVQAPVLLNGQIMPGDVDQFRFRARKGQKLVIETQARALIPYLADGVPGWFQAAQSLYDSKGHEVAFADDYRFSPDPVMLYEIPHDGEYKLEIRDALYRGREDFVYRASIAERPFITGMFPLGGRSGGAADAWISDWNAQWQKVRLDTRSGEAVRQTAWRRNDWYSNRVLYGVSTLPEGFEVEPNNRTTTGPMLNLPQVVNGCIAATTDTDTFHFQGRGGDRIVAEVLARRLHSPLDSLLRLRDHTGKILAWNDDHEDKEAGLLTHHADSYLTATLPADGVYSIDVSDAQQQGGPAHAYRLRVSRPHPDFSLYITPSSLTVMTGLAVPITAHVIRKDGFDGPVDVAVRDHRSGFSIGGGRIPAGCSEVRMTLRAPREQAPGPVTLELEGRGDANGLVIVRRAVPAEYQMQAFAYWHLVPSQLLLVDMKGPRRMGPSVELAESGPVAIPVGGTGAVRLNVPRLPMLQSLKFELNEPPKGISLKQANGPNGPTLTLAADETVKPGLSGNLIVAASIDRPPGRRQQQQAPKGKAGKDSQRVSLGCLPAIPFEVVKR